MQEMNNYFLYKDNIMFEKFLFKIFTSFVYIISSILLCHTFNKYLYGVFRKQNVIQKVEKKIQERDLEASAGF